MMIEWLHVHEAALWLIGTLSIFTLVGTIIVTPILVIHIPANYFNRERQRPGRYHGQYSLIRLLALVLKNIVGIIFVLAGLAMLLLPGQGLITILIGIMLLNFPGKLALERRMVQQPTLLRGINWIRAKAKKPALQVPKLAPTAGVDSGEKE
jgi:hypothetical protein